MTAKATGSQMQCAEYRFQKISFCFALFVCLFLMDECFALQTYIPTVRPHCLSLQAAPIVLKLSFFKHSFATAKR